MSRFTQRSTLAAAALAGALLAAPAQAGAPRGAGACAPAVAWSAGGPACRVAHVRRRLPPRAYAPYALGDVVGVIPVRYVSFLVLGVGY